MEFKDKDVALNEAITEAVFNPGSEVWWVEKNFAETSDKFLRAKRICEDYFQVEKVSLGNMQITFKNGSKLAFKSYHNSDHLRGFNVDHVFFAAPSDLKPLVNDVTKFTAVI